jgi:hypothetical protein
MRSSDGCVVFENASLIHIACSAEPCSDVYILFCLSNVCSRALSTFIVCQFLRLWEGTISL